MADPLVSIICSVRNGEDVLPATLESVLGQSYRAWELVVVDDGSTDGSLEILRRHADREPRVRVVPTPGIGRSKALNLAIRESRGSLIANIDADDPCHPRRIELQVRAFEREPGYAVIGTDHIVLLAGERPRWDSNLPASAPVVIAIGDALRRGNPVNHSSVMMRRADLVAVGAYAEDRRRQVDYDLFVRLAARGHRIGILPLKLSSRRLHAGQSFEARDRARYLLGSLAVQLRAIRSLPGSPTSYALIPARLLWGLLPLGLRSRIKRRRRAQALPADDELPAAGARLRQ